MPAYDYKYLICSAQALGNAGDEYTDDEIDFGVTTPNVNAKDEFGMHIVVTTAFATLTGGCIMFIVHGAATAPTTKHTGMFIPVASLTLGAHFFVPAGSIPLLQYARGLMDVVTENATAGNMTIWFGPKTGGEG